MRVTPARELPNLSLQDALQLVHLLCGARVAEVREGGAAVARAVPDGELAPASALRGDHGEPRGARGRRVELRGLAHGSDQRSRGSFEPWQRENRVRRPSLRPCIDDARRACEPPDPV